LLGDDLVLRLPRNHPHHFNALRTESIAVPAVRAVGVQAPELIVFDETCTVLPGPYAIYARVHGRTLESLQLPPSAAPNVWRDLGRDLARTHLIENAALEAALPAPGPLPDLPDLVESHASAGRFTASEARWLQVWLRQLSPLALQPVASRLVHGDTQAANVMVRDEPPRYTALMDRGSAAWGVAVDDLAVVPLAAAPFMLEGHRDVAPLDDDAHVEARSVWRHLLLALRLIRRGPLPGFAWAERPLSMLLDLLMFFAADPPEPWRALRPPANGS
jgi:aminoglycoside phosphotransferase (APT) family kinase protein